MTTPDYEQMLQEFYTSILQRGDACIDVGANVGRHTLPIANCVAPEGKVFAFEPIPSVAADLTARLSGDGVSRCIEMHQCALSNRNGDTDFTFVSNNPGYSGLRPRHYDGPVTTEIIRVRTQTLDSMANTMPSIRYIKIDCEGGELLVLQGANALIERDRPIVTFECGDSSLESYEYGSGDVFDYWHSHNYGVESIFREALDRKSFIDACARQEFWDYIAVPARP